MSNALFETFDWATALKTFVGKTVKDITCVTTDVETESKITYIKIVFDDDTTLGIDTSYTPIIHPITDYSMTSTSYYKVRNLNDSE